MPAKKNESKAKAESKPKSSITVLDPETFMGRTVRVLTEGIEGPLRLSGATMKSDVHLDNQGQAQISFMHPGEFTLTAKDGTSATIMVAGG